MKLKLLTMCVVIAAALALSGKSSAQITSFESNPAEEAQILKGLHECEALALGEGICDDLKGKELQTCKDKVAFTCMRNMFAGGVQTDPRALCVEKDVQFCAADWNNVLKELDALGISFFLDVANNATKVKIVLRHGEVTDTGMQYTNDEIELNVVDGLVAAIAFDKKGDPHIFDANGVELQINLAAIGAALEFMGLPVVYMVNDPNNRIDYYATYKAMLQLPEEDLIRATTNVSLFISKIPDYAQGGIFYDAYGQPAPVAKTYVSLVQMATKMFINPEPPPVVCAYSECVLPDGSCDLACVNCIDGGGQWDPKAQICNLQQQCTMYTCMDVNGMPIAQCKYLDDICAQQCRDGNAACVIHGPDGCTGAMKTEWPECQPAKCDSITCLCDGAQVDCSVGFLCSGYICAIAWSPPDCSPGYEVCPK